MERPVVDFENLTVRDVLDILDYQKGPEHSRAFRSRLAQADIDLDEQYATFGTKKTLEAVTLDEFLVEGNKKLARGSPFQTLTTMHNELLKFAAETETNQQINIPNEDYGDKAVKLGIVTGKQTRGTRVFKAFPRSDILFPKLAEAVRKIPDKDPREAIVFNLLMPMRPGEVADLKIGEIDLETGQIAGKLRGQKTRAEIIIPEAALAIIRERAKDKKPGDPLFKTSTPKMTEALKASGFIESMDEYEQIMGRKIKGAADIRKLIPAIIAYELDYPDAISEIMGHSEFSDIGGDIAKMTKRSYIGTGRMFGEDFEFSTTTALKSLQNKWAETLGLGTVNELFDVLDVDAPDFTDPDNPYKIRVVFEGENLEIEGKPTLLSPQEIEANRASAIATTNLRVAQFELEAAQARGEAVDRDVETAQRTIRDKDILKEGAAAQAEIDEANRRARQTARQNQELNDIDDKLDGRYADLETDDLFDEDVTEAGDNKLPKKPSKILKAIPVIGTAAALQAAATKKSQADEAFRQGRPIEGRLRSFQAAEEVFSPLPVTTGDVEDFYTSRVEQREQRAPQTAQQMQERAERMKTRQQRATSSQMDELLQK